MRSLSRDNDYEHFFPSQSFYFGKLFHTLVSCENAFLLLASAYVCRNYFRQISLALFRRLGWRRKWRRRSTFETLDGARSESFNWCNHVNWIESLRTRMISSPSWNHWDFNKGVLAMGCLKCLPESLARGKSAAMMGRSKNKRTSIRANMKPLPEADDSRRLFFVFESAV